MTAPLRHVRWPVATSVAIAVCIAAYAGLRMPSAWATTLQAVSITDGFYKRFLVGTVLRPFAIATRYDYWYFTLFSFLVLAALLAFIVAAILRSRSTSCQVLGIAWLVLPTGAFLFHTVGYLDHVIYLLLFCALLLLRRERTRAAIAVMSLAPLVHELALLTAIPLFGIALCYRFPLRRAVAYTAVPAAVNFLVLVLPASSAGAGANLSASLSRANFPYRTDALAIFDRSAADNRALYDVGEQIASVAPPTILLALGFFLIWRAQATTLASNTMRPTWILLLSCLAILAPALLGFGGWDSNRWIAFAIANFVITCWLYLSHATHPELRRPAILIAAVIFLVISQVPLYYFDSKHPRTLYYKGVLSFIGEIRSGKLFELPKL